MKQLTIIILILLICTFGFSQSIKTDSLERYNSPEEYLEKAQSLYEKGHTLNAIHTLESGCQYFKEVDELQILLSELYFENGNYDKAKPLLEKYQYSHFSACKRLIQIHEFENNPEDALHILKRELRKDQTNTWFLKHAGKNYEKTDSLLQAMQSYMGILVMDHDNQAANYRIARIYLKLDQYDKAIQHCNQVLQNDSTNKKFLRTKGIAFYNKKSYRSAARCFESLTELGDSADVILKRLAICRIKTEDYMGALNLFEHLYPENKDDFEINYYLGKCIRYSQTPEASLYYFERADSLLQPDPRSLETIEIDKALVYSYLKNHKKAIEAYLKAYHHHADPEYLFQVAVIYDSQLHKAESALEYYQRFLDALPEIPEEKPEEEEEAIIISLESIAKRSVDRLKEELFFKSGKKK